MDTFEYKIDYFGAHEMKAYNMSTYLNTGGSDGWELVQIIIKYMMNDPSSIANYTFIWKRKIPK